MPRACDDNPVLQEIRKASASSIGLGIRGTLSRFGSGGRVASVDCKTRQEGYCFQ